MNKKTIQEFSRKPENIQGQLDVFQESRTNRVLIANLRTILGAQGRLATTSGVAAIWAFWIYAGAAKVGLKSTL